MRWLSLDGSLAFLDGRGAFFVGWPSGRVFHLREGSARRPRVDGREVTRIELRRGPPSLRGHVVSTDRGTVLLLARNAAVAHATAAAWTGPSADVRPASYSDQLLDEIAEVWHVATVGEPSEGVTFVRRDRESTLVGLLSALHLPRGASVDAWACALDKVTRLALAAPSFDVSFGAHARALAGGVPRRHAS
jgi:hypothetical protein